MKPVAGLGARRPVVGAHYGLMDWVAQRVTAVVMLVFTVVCLVAFLTAHNFSYEGWWGLFSGEWMKSLTFVTLLSLFYHAWIGMRDIWMDYIKPTMLRLVLEMLTILWLVGCAGYSMQTLWSI
jgi:succinate dehydrogenase / fumarate reductase membrane anchor subunit